METTTILDLARWSAGAVVLIGGLALFLRGMRGEADGAGGLVRRHAGRLGRIEGWRRTILGLAVAGLGAALLLESRFLLFLSLGIGFVEVLEASVVIAAWRRGPTSQRGA